MARKEEKDSLEKLSENIREAQALVASFHTRLVEMGTDMEINESACHYLQVALTNLMATRECIARQLYASDLNNLLERINKQEAK